MIIEGSPKGTEEAEREIKAILLKKKNRKQTYMTKIMTINKKRHGYLIGREGATLRCILQGIKNVHVRFPNKDVESDFVIIHGEKESVERVMEKIEYMLSIC